MGDNTPNCKHLDHELLAKFWDKKGVERVVAELCGRTIVDKDGKRVGDPKSVKFIEASWVERPAFYGAVLNHYVSELPKSASNILEFPTEKLHLAMEDIFKLRVADKSGMLVLRVAQAEIARRMREDRLWKIAGRLV
jgi:6-pyruvoyl-tetrahydropterin synthase